MLERDLRVSKDVNIAIYTTSDFPYGGAPENFVRQMALGLNSLDTFVKIILLRGHYTESTINDTGIDCSNLLFKRRFRRQFLKFVELVFIIFAIPYSVIRNRIQHRTKVILLYGVEYFYLVLPFFIVGKILGIKVYRVITDRYTDRGIAPTWWKWPKVFFYQLQYNYFDRYLAGVICLSNYLKDHDIGEKGLSLEGKIEIVKALSQQGRVIISSEGTVPKELEPFVFKSHPAHMHQFLKSASLIVSESLTMAAEAAFLGTPAICISTAKAGTLDEEVRLGLIELYRNPNGLTNRAVKLFKDIGYKEQFKAQLNRVLADLIDPTAFM